MGRYVPGPVCSTRVGDDWIDLGTMCRSRSSKPAVTDVALLVVQERLSPFKAKFDRDHVYSKAPEAARKRDIDLQIIGDDYSRSAEINLGNEKYLKELIRLGSSGKQKVSDGARKIQFFIVRGGAEGLLPEKMGALDMRSIDAGKLTGESTDTDGKKTTNAVFDLNDLLAVFDPKGKLIGAALLQRPIFLAGRWGVTDKNIANDIYNAWNNKEVSIYRNTNFDIPYLGLVLDDGMKKRGWVDMHKQEATNGCIFIVDPGTPDLGDPKLDTFEPKLLNDVLASIGKRPDQVTGRISLGIMHLVDI